MTTIEDPVLETHNLGMFHYPNDPASENWKVGMERNYGDIFDWTSLKGAVNVFTTR